MEGTVIQETRRDGLGRLLCDVLGVLLGLAFLTAGLFLLSGTIDYARYGGTGGRHINSAIGCALGVAALLLLSICLAVPTKLYEGKRLRIAGQLAASLTSAVTVASVLLPIVVMVSLSMSAPEPGDVAGMVGFAVIIIGLAAAVVFLPCTWILARKSKMRLAHLAIGTMVAGAAGGLLGYLCY